MVTEASTGDDVKAEPPRKAVARQQSPHRVARRWRQSPLMARRNPSTRARQSPSAIALLLSKKGKLVRQEAGPSHSRGVRNASGLHRLSSMLAHRSVRPHSLTLTELTQITNNFSNDQLLGEGGFGKVYKGVLPNGDTIAVKKLKWTTTGIQDKQYENEARHLMRLKHPNIVQLVGYCSETEKELVMYNGKYVYAEKSERLLCLEYLPKGSLREHLSDESSGLDWDTRYKIIKGICYGLHYLHEEWQPGTPIIHRDLKPANILLDDNMVPKIVDFGMSRLFGEEQTRTITKNFDGTLGYMAPEYLNGGIISKELDIFSLGVIIIEIVMGHRKYPDETSEKLIEQVLEKWRNRLEKAPDHISTEFDCEQLARCIRIGVACMSCERLDRPTTSQIIKAFGQMSRSRACSPGASVEVDDDQSGHHGGGAPEEAEQLELRRGPWTVDEDLALLNYIAVHGEGRWNSVACAAGLKRTGKSCRLRWWKYLRPDVKCGNFTVNEQLLILELHSRWGNRWSKIAKHLPGRTDNEIKNYWRTRVQKHAKQLYDANSKRFK